MYLQNNQDNNLNYNNENSYSAKRHVVESNINLESTSIETKNVEVEEVNLLDFLPISEQEKGFDVSANDLDSVAQINTEPINQSTIIDEVELL